MRHFGKNCLTGILLVFLLATCGFAEIPAEVIPGGQAIGIQLQTDGVYVTDFSPDGESPAQTAGVKIGDRIAQIGNETITRIDEIPAAVNRAGGDSVLLRILRGGTLIEIPVQPQSTQGGWKLGLSVRDTIAGIGTLTYYDPQGGQYGALGHPVNDPTGGTVAARDGQIFPVEITQVRRGEQGKPGALSGSYLQEEPFGSIVKNSPQGVFGSLDQPPEGTLIPVAPASEVQKGPALIRCTVDGTGVKDYAVEITALRPADPNSRNLQLKVTDKALLEQTGGIVQGISGAPIIQNGKLIGAVTHVLVDQPTRGYGIYIGNMLDAAQDAATPNAA